MKEPYRPQIGDRVRFNAEARRSNFRDAKADGRKVFTVKSVAFAYGFSTPDVQLSDGSTWNAAWLEPVA